jgi:hypothetical protein
MIVLSLLAPLAAHAATAAAASTIPGYLPDRWVVSASLGLGLANTYGSNGTPLIAVTAERGVTPKISVGGSAGYATSKYSYFGYTAKYGYTVVAARGSYHFTQAMPDKPLDLYAGVSLGYNHVGVTETGPYAYGYSVGGSYMLYGIHGGARWYFNPKTAVFAELGYGLGALAVGASMRL